MSILAPFQPKPGGFNVVTNGASQDANLDPSCKQIRVTNSGTAVAFVRLKFAGDATAAAATDQAILPNQAMTLSKMGDPANGHSLLAVFGAAGSTVYVQSGEGW